MARSLAAEEPQRSGEPAPPSGSWPWRGGLLVVGLGGLLFSAYALWHAGGLAADALRRLGQPSPAGVAAVVATELAPPPLDGTPGSPDRGRLTPPGAAQEPVLTARSAAALSFDDVAEDSEKVVRLGHDAGLEDAALPLAIGEVPPDTYPHAPCDDVFVYIVTVAEGAPRHSAASLGIGKAGPARFRRPGERLGEWTVLAIEDDWLGLNPDVWLEKDGRLCRAELAGNPARVHVALKKPVPPRRSPKKRKRRRR